MRETYTSLQTKCQSYTRDNSAAALTFFQNEINISQRFLFAAMESFVNQRAQTTSTIANQQYYHMPPDSMNIETVTINQNGTSYTLDPVDSQRTWDRLNAVTFSGEAIPKYFFVRRDDFGIFPIPQDVYTLTLNYTYRLKDLTAEDYTTGTISITNDDETVTGVGTTFTAAMVGRWLKATGEGLYYRIASVTDTTHLELETKFEGTTVSGVTYVIGETPELPPDMHILLTYQAVANYYSGFRRDDKLGVYWTNMFWTGDPRSDSRDMRFAVGGLLGAKKRYSRRSNSRIVRRSSQYQDYFNTKIWGTTVTSM